ncbi:MAG: hypothetical protein ACYSSI_01485 [Planctomycetota bacterium]|jgi:hypothetical protein
MVKTLRITGIFAAIFVVVLLAVPVVFGMGGDKKSGESITGISVIEKFRKNKNAQKSSKTGQDSPLVIEATKFALYLNPPPKPEPVKKSVVSAQPTISTKRKPEVVSAKFNLVGTSFFASHPEKSLALIDIPAKGLRWVRQSSEVGHLLIDQVKDGVIVVKDGQSSFELTALKPQRISLIKGEGLEEGGSKTMPNPVLQAPPAGEEFEKALEKLKKEGKDSPGAAALQAMMEQIQRMEKESNQKNKSSTQSPKEGPGSSRKSGRDSRSRGGPIRVGSSESRKLGQLGQELKKVQPPQDVNEQSSAKKRLIRTKSINNRRSIRSNRNPKVPNRNRLSEAEKKK